MTARSCSLSLARALSLSLSLSLSLPPCACKLQTLLLELAVRYKKDTIYTYVGDILCAINPFKAIPGIYDDEKSVLYSGIQDLSAAPPHIFAIADAAFHAMIGNIGTAANQVRTLLLFCFPGVCLMMPSLLWCFLRLALESKNRLPPPSSSSSYFLVHFYIYILRSIL